MTKEISLFLLLFSRLLGIFVLSPFLSFKLIPSFVRIGLSFTLSLLLFPPALQTMPDLSFTPIFILSVLKELLLGYLLGFLISLVFEAALFAGQLIGAISGFSAETIDPDSSDSHPLLGRFFLILISLLFFALDLHHVFFRFVYESYLIFPANASLVFNEESISIIIEATSKIFHFALSYSLGIIAPLLCLILLFAILSRKFAIFIHGFPLQILIALFGIAIFLSYFSQILTQNFSEVLQSAKNSLFPL